MSTSETASPPALLCAQGGPDMELSDAALRQHLNDFVAAMGERDDVLILPPDCELGQLTFISVYSFRQTLSHGFLSTSSSNCIRFH